MSSSRHPLELIDPLLCNDVAASNNLEELKDNALSMLCSVAEQFSFATEHPILAAKSKEAAATLIV
jgi:hypothetical protein